MTPQVIRTRITDLFGIRHPLVCGGMMWLADGAYVGAVSRAGCIGFITPRSFPTLEAYRAEIHKAREISEDGAFGVNLYVSARPEANEQLQLFLDVAIEEGVRFVETAGFSPKAFMPKIKDAGIKVIHKCTTLRHAESAQRAGVDAITILGAEAGGHPGTDLIGAMVQGAIVPAALDVPVVLAGGMGTGRQLMACLALGAEGMLLASRMIVSSEIWAHEAYKEHVVDMGASDTRVIMSVFGDSSRVIYNETAAAILSLEAEGARDYEVYRPHVNGPLQRETYASGDWTKGAMSAGQAVAFADRIAPAEEIIDGIMAEAASVRGRLANL